MLEDNLKSNLSFSELFQGRLISETIDVSISRVELDQIKFIFEDHFKLSRLFKSDKLSNITLVDRNFLYDSFKFDYGELTYLIKIGDEEDNYLFKREFDFLEKIQEDELAPKPMINGVGKDYSFLITSYEFGQSINQIGKSELFSNLKTLASSLKLLHENKEETSELNYFLDLCFSQGSFEEILSEDLFNELSGVKNFKKCQLILKELQDLIRLQIKSFSDSNTSICHMNLTESNILMRGPMIKFINFDKSFSLNPLWDLAITSIYLDLTNYPKLESKFLMHYSKEDYDYNCEALPAYKDVCFKICLHGLICAYYFKIITKVNQHDTYKMYKLYETIRPLIHNEFPVFLEVLDEMFGDFQKHI
jgi:hypothetical protein